MTQEIEKREEFLTALSVTSIAAERAGIEATRPELFRTIIALERIAAEWAERGALKSERDALIEENYMLNKAINVVSRWIKRGSPELYGEFIDVIFPVLTRKR